MIPRLLLVGGPGGSGSSTRAAEFADSWARDGHRVGVAAIDPTFGASGLTTEPGCVPVRVDAQLPGPLRVAARSWRVDPFVAEELVRRLEGLPLLWQLPQLIERFDRVVVDAGSALGRMLLGAHLVPWLLTEAGPLHGGWLRATRPVTALAMGGSGLGRAGAEQLAGVTERAEELSQLVISPQTAVVLTADAAAAKVRHLGAAVSLAQARLGATVGTSERGKGAEQVLAGVPQWCDVEQGWEEQLADPARDVEIRGSAREGAVSWRIPLPYSSFEDVDLEQSGTRLVLGVHDHRRTFLLPSLLDRHVAQSAYLRHGILEVTFRPENA